MCAAAGSQNGQCGMDNTEQDNVGKDHRLQSAQKWSLQKLN